MEEEHVTHREAEEMTRTVIHRLRIGVSWGSSAASRVTRKGSASVHVSAPSSFFSKSCSCSWNLESSLNIALSELWGICYDSNGITGPLYIRETASWLYEGESATY